MAKHRTAPSPEPAPSQDPVLETAPTAPASPLPEPPDQDVIIEPPLSQIPVPELTGPQCEAELAKREHYPRFWFTGTHEHSSVIFFQFSPECAVRCVGTDIGSTVRASVFAADQLSSPRIYPETSKQ